MGRVANAGSVALRCRTCDQSPALLPLERQPCPGAQARKEGGDGERPHSPTLARLRPCLLAVIPVLARAPDEALVAPLASWALGLGEGLLEGVLLGVHLVVQEVSRQLRPVPDLNLCGGPSRVTHSLGYPHSRGTLP